MTGLCGAPRDLPAPVRSRLAARADERRDAAAFRGPDGLARAGVFARALGDPDGEPFAAAGRAAKLSAALGHTRLATLGVGEEHWVAAGVYTAPRARPQRRTRRARTSCSRCCASCSRDSARGRCFVQHAAIILVVLLAGMAVPCTPALAATVRSTSKRASSSTAPRGRADRVRISLSRDEPYGGHDFAYYSVEDSARSGPGPVAGARMRGRRQFVRCDVDTFGAVRAVVRLGDRNDVVRGGPEARRAARRRPAGESAQWRRGPAPR